MKTKNNFMANRIKGLVPTVFFCTCSMLLQAQPVNVTGYVKHEGKVLQINSSLPVIGASIFIPELRIGTTTDASGYYKLNIANGIYTIEISSVSFKTLIDTINVQGATIKDFILAPSGNELTEVIISGSSIKTIIRESPIPIATMSNTQWRQTASANLVDAIVKLPGMSQITTGSALSKPVIRGLGFNRVITMHDGIRQEDNQWGEEHSLQIDEYSIDRYEIIRGAAGSLMYGSDGLGGVVSMLSQRPVSDGIVKGGFLSNYQSNNNLYGLSAFVNGNKKGFEWMGRLSHKNAGNYRNRYDGRVYGSNFKELNVNGMLGINRSWGYSRLYVTQFSQNINIIGGERDANGRFVKTIRINDSTSAPITVANAELNGRAINPSNSQNLTNRKIAMNNFVMLRNKASISLNAGYSANLRKEFGNVFTPNVPDLFFYLQTLYYDARYNLPETKGWETTIGTNGMYQTMNNKGQESLYPDFKLFDNGVFVFTKKKINRWNISGGVRFDIRRLSIEKLYVDSAGKFQATPLNAVEERFKGFENTFSNVTASVGTVYKINNRLWLRANMARGFRAPTVPEISSNGEHAGTFRYEVGNINAKSEVSFQADAGLSYEDKNWYADANIFRNSISNYSYSEKVLKGNGQDSIIGGLPVFRYQGEGTGLLWGAESQITYNPERAKWLAITQSLSMVMTNNSLAQNDSARFLPLMPPPRFITRVKLTRKDMSKYLRNAYFTFELEQHLTQNRVLLAYNTETITPAYALLNVGFGTDIINAKKQTILSVYFNANNILDAAYQSHQSRLKYLAINAITNRQGVFNMGRNFSVKVFVPMVFSR